MFTFPQGMQTQTAECLVIGEITCNQMVVVLNKIDMIPDNKRQPTIEKVLSSNIHHSSCVNMFWLPSSQRRF